MSGSLFGAAGSLIGLSIGGGVTIGSVTLTDFEIPDTIHWGTKQLLKEHVYPGGQNVIQPLGPTREPISWSGQMFSSFGTDATDRARALDAIAAAGLPVAISWGDLHFTGVLEQFSADYKHQWQGRYSLTIRLQWDYQATPAQPSPSNSTANDLTIALQLANNAQSLATALTSVQSVQNSTPAPGALFATQATIQAGIVALGSAAAVSGAVLANTAPGPRTIGALTAAAGTSAGTVAAFGYTARAAVNWALVAGISTPNNTPQQVQPDLSQYTGA